MRVTSQKVKLTVPPHHFKGKLTVMFVIMHNTAHRINFFAIASSSGSNWSPGCLARKINR